MSAVIDPDQESEEDVVRAIALVTTFSTIVLFALPLLQPVVGLDEAQVGLWIGASVHEVAQVVAAARRVGLRPGHRDSREAQSCCPAGAIDRGGRAGDRTPGEGGRS